MVVVRPFPSPNVSIHSCNNLRAGGLRVRNTVLLGKVMLKVLLLLHWELLWQMWPMVHLCSFSKVYDIRSLQEQVLQQSPSFHKLSAAFGTLLIPQHDARTKKNIEM